MVAVPLRVPLVVLERVETNTVPLPVPLAVPTEIQLSLDTDVQAHEGELAVIVTGVLPPVLGNISDEGETVNVQETGPSWVTGMMRPPAVMLPEREPCVVFGGTVT